MKIVIDSDNLFHDCLLALTLIVIFQFYWYGRRIIRFLWNQLGKSLIDKVKKNGRIKRKVTPVLVPERSRSLSIPPSPNGKDSPSHQGLRKARIGLRLSGSNLNMGPERGRTSPLTIGNSPGHSSFLSISSGDIFNDYEISYTRPSSKVKLEWVSKPKTILLVKKWKDYYVTSCLAELIEWIGQEHPEIALMVEPETYKELGHLKHVNFLLFDTSLVAQEADQVDLIICLGGDGTVLHISSLFQRSVPPIMAFNLGSMGFLTPFNFKNFKEDLKPVLRGKCFIKLRLRLHCTIIKKGVEQLDLDYHALNEATIDRGASPFLSHLECYCDDKLITTVQADGIIVATATGSTAYSLSSGGSLVHPLLPALLFTPICPHSLSFRPVVLPSSVTLKVMIPPESHCSASISFDGRHRQELHPGDGVVMRISEWPVATVSKTDQIGEWFSSLAQHLNWNKRVFQKSKKEDNKREEFNKKEELKKEEELKREETTKMTETFFNLRASM